MVSETPTDTIRRAIEDLHADTATIRQWRTTQPATTITLRHPAIDPDLADALAEYLAMATIVAATGHRLSNHPLKIAHAYLGETT